MKTVFWTFIFIRATFFKATNNEKMTDAFKQFCDYFSEKLELKKN